MKITMAVPVVSFERFFLLFGLIESVQAGTYKDIHIVVVVDGNRELYETIERGVKKRYLDNVTVIMNEKRMDWVFSINRVFKEFDSEYYIYASDDLVFPPTCIEDAMKMMQEKFPDGFGLVSLWRRNKAIVGLIGRRFVEYFPKREVLCPDYIHYSSDAECFRIAEKMGKLARRPKDGFRIKHYTIKDDTQNLAQEARKKDTEVCNERADKGYEWGIDFNLVGRK